MGNIYGERMQRRRQELEKKKKVRRKKILKQKRKKRIAKKAKSQLCIIKRDFLGTRDGEDKFDCFIM